jgi:membrane dipeptidase
MDHVASLVGHRHLALGLDFAGFDGPVVEGLEDASGYPRLAEFLLGRGWSLPDVEGVFHGNAARVLGE